MTAEVVLVCFARLDGAFISNLNFVSVNVTGYSWVGSVAGWCKLSTIENCSSSGVFTGDLEVGGITGQSADSDIINCHSVSNVTGNITIGGIIGVSDNGYILKCSSSGSVTGINNSLYSGGLVGSCGSYLEQSFSLSNVSGYRATGGLVGDFHDYYDSLYVKDCFSKGNITATGNYSGGLIGANSTTVTNCYSTGAVNGSSNRGGLIGINQGIVNNCYWDMETSGIDSSAAGVGRTTAEMTLPYAENTYVDWNFETAWRDDITNQNNGYPTFLWVSGIEEDDDYVLPKTATLYQNYPNPFNPATEINFTLKQTQNVNLSVFNSKGELVQTLFVGKKNKGLHSTRFDASRLNSGIYFYKLTVQKIILLQGRCYYLR
jgi:hypothetical protein